MSTVHEKLKLRIKEVILAKREVDASEIEELYGRTSFLGFCKTAKEREYISEEEYLHIVAQILSIPYFDIDKVRISREEVEGFSDVISDIYILSLLGTTNL